MLDLRCLYFRYVEVPVPAARPRPPLPMVSALDFSFQRVHSLDRRRAPKMQPKPPTKPAFRRLWSPAKENNRVDTARLKFHAASARGLKQSSPASKRLLLKVFGRGKVYGVVATSARCLADRDARRLPRVSLDFESLFPVLFCSA